jgi:histidinol-phosphate aminotransferase
MSDASPPGGRAALRIARALFRDVVAYPTARTACDVDLSDNTNLFGVPPAALRELRALPAELVMRYPGLHTDALSGALARYVGVVPESVVTGCGSDDVIDSAMRAFAEPGDAVAFCDPTFSMVPVFARVNGLVPVPVGFRGDHDIDADALVATGARVTFVCAPNNPTSTAASRAAILRVLEGSRGLVIVDEAYAEFSGESIAGLAATHERLLVTRTLSKAWGMAGLRVGYGIGAPSLVREVEKARGPYTVNAPAERAAAAALEEDEAWMRARVAEAIAVRERFGDALRALDLDPLPSASNFVCVPVRDAPAVARRMRALGVAVRAFPAIPRIGDALRIGVGPWPAMERALTAMQEAGACG